MTDGTEPTPDADTPLPGVVTVRYLGRLGNNLFQYCFGRILAEQLGYALRTDPIDLFPGIVSLRTGALSDRPPWERLLVARPWPWVCHLSGHAVDVGSVLALRPKRILIRGYFQRYEYYRPHKEVIRNNWLRLPPGGQSGPDDLTIHIRAGDLWQRNLPPGRAVHPLYPALPYSYYANILAVGRWRQVRVVTDDSGDAMVSKLAKAHGAEVITADADGAFRLLASSSNLVLAVSSYSWWSAWLSSAQRIFYPLTGYFDPAQSRQQPPAWQPDVVVDDEPRYQYVNIPFAGPWRGTETDRQRLLEN